MNHQRHVILVFHRSDYITHVLQSSLVNMLNIEDLNVNGL